MNYFTQRMARMSKITATALVVALITLPASASTFFGDLTFSGDFTSNGSLELTTDLVFPGNDFDVDGAAGDFATETGIGPGDLGSIADLDLTLGGGPVQLVSIAGVTFTLESIDIVAQTDAFLLVTGEGFVTYEGMDTDAFFNLSANAIGSLSNFSAGITSVPVPGAVWLLGSALLALGLRRRS